jgi:hypothetical protein
MSKPNHFLLRVRTSHSVFGQAIQQRREVFAVGTLIAERPYRERFTTASVIEVLVDDIDRLAREVKDVKALPPMKKRRIGFVLDDG